MDTDDKALYRLSTTDEYHRQDLETLGWELTVCNSLQPENTPVRRVLKNNASYGDLLYRFLNAHITLANITKVLEVGGGYGYLMKDLLGNNPAIQASMLDVSPALLKKQQESLTGHSVAYYLDDALKMDKAFFKAFELIIFNENLGDFPALADVNPVILDGACDDEAAAMARHFFDAYGLERPSSRFNLNIGAMLMLEKVCGADAPYIFIGEHSCEWQMPSDIRPYFTASATGDPRRIRLKGHDEYTIKFSYLQVIAKRLGYQVKRGPFADYIVPHLNGYVRAVLASRGLYSDNEEIICQFIGDLYEYEYLILTKQ
ncbi:MAG: putative cytosolic protein [Deltaproteobacteria bacterium]|nr:putative cytosolic protein [Deltaproteobacteria bacterium]